MPFIDAILEADRKAPRKQRHTAHRIWQRIRRSGRSGEWRKSTIRQYVRERKRELGWSTRATCVPQSYEPGQEGQVDWYEAWAELGGEQVLLQVFAMRSMASGAAFHRAYQRATQQAFLEAHEQPSTILAEFSGSEVRQSESGGEEDPARLSAGGNGALHAFRSHWRFAERVLHALRSPRKGRHRRRGRLLSPQPLGADAARRGISRSSTHSCWPPVTKTNSARLPGAASRWERR